MLWKDVKGICGQTIDKVPEQKTETQARLESGSKVLENKRLKIGLMLHNIIETILYDRFLFWKEKLASPASMIIIAMVIWRPTLTNHFQLQKLQKNDFWLAKQLQRLGYNQEHWHASTTGVKKRTTFLTEFRDENSELRRFVNLPYA